MLNSIKGSITFALIKFYGIRDVKGIGFIHQWWLDNLVKDEVPEENKQMCIYCGTKEGVVRSCDYWIETNPWRKYFHIWWALNCEGIPIGKEINNFNKLHKFGTPLFWQHHLEQLRKLEGENFEFQATQKFKIMEEYFNHQHETNPSNENSLDDVIFMDADSYNKNEASSELDESSEEEIIVSK